MDLYDYTMENICSIHYKNCHKCAIIENKMKCI